LENDIKIKLTVQKRLEIILTEYKILQDLITRLENNEFKIRGWLFTIITGLSLAYFSKNIMINAIGYLIVSIFCIMMFLVYELLHRIPKMKAFHRVKCLEDIIKKEGNYKGPKLYQSLTGKRSLNEMLKEFKKVQIWLPYLMIIIIIIAIVIFKTCIF
jgi:hypothetical protein